jgi:hypothetical protein
LAGRLGGRAVAVKPVNLRADPRGMRLEFPADFGLLVPILLSLLSLRLFRAAHRSRGLPELLVGLYFLLVPFAISLSLRVGRFDPATAWVVRAVSNLLFTCGGVALLLFAWSVFRPDARWARLLAWGGATAVFAVWALAIPLGVYATDLSLFLLLPVYASYVWVFVESVRYYLMLRRRQRLGLADPVLVNRFLLFAIWTGSVGVITLMGVAGSLVQLARGTFHDGGALADPVILLITRVLVLPIAVSIFLTFLAPARYHAWLRAKASAAS